MSRVHFFDNKVMLSTEDLVFKERPAKKLVDWYVGSYTIEKVVSTNAVKLQLPTSIRTYPVVNISRVVQYKEQVEGQKRKEVKPIEVEEVEEYIKDESSRLCLFKFSFWFLFSFQFIFHFSIFRT